MSTPRLVAGILLLCSCGGHPPQVAAPTPAPVAAPVVAAVKPLMPPPPKLRLPDTVVPRRQAVTLNLVPTRPHFDGSTQIEVDVRAETTVIWLHAHDLKIHRVEIQPPVAQLTPMASDEWLALVSDRAILPGRVTLDLDFSGELPAREASGAYRQEEQGQWYVFTQFEATDARRAFPCFDEPSYKIPWEIALDVPLEAAAFANTPQVSERKIAPDTKHVAFAPTRPLPSYLVAFAVGPLQIVDAGTVGRKKAPLRIIVPKGKSAEAAYAAQITGDIIKRLEDYFDLPYPYEKLDHVAVPQKGGAMENAGLVTYGTSTILGKPGERNIGLERGYPSIAAHELGHMWFGDLVTTAWWDDIWLNEAFATWISAKIVEEMRPAWQGAAGRVQSRNGVMGGDALASARRIRQPIESKHDIANAFDGITYQKGAAVISMFESYVGPEKFRDGVRAYLKKHAYGNATAKDFLDDVGAVVDERGPANAPLPSLAAAFATFLDQPGYPLVTATLACPERKSKEPPKLTLSQKRYRRLGAAETPDETWIVPVCVRTPGENICKLLGPQPLEITLAGPKCPAWVLPNAGGVGYYRVDYQGDLLHRLLADGGKALTLPERLSVLGDVGALVTNGSLPAERALELVPVLAKDPDRHVTGAVAGIVAGLSDSYVPDDLRANYRRFVQRSFGARARALGWKPKSGENDDTRLVRSQLVSLVADEGDDATLRAEARALAERWLTDRKAIEPELVGTVLALAAQRGDRALWDKLHAAAKVETDRRDRGRLLGALGSFEDPALVDAGLQLAMTDEFDPREAMSLVFGPAGDRRTRQRAYDFAKSHYDAITGRLPKAWGAGLVRMGGGFCDADHRADVETFFKERTPALEGGPRTFAQTLEGIDACIARRSAQQASIRTFLGRQ